MTGREKCAGTVKAKPGEEEALDRFWQSNHYVAGKSLYHTIKRERGQWAVYYTSPQSFKDTFSYSLAQHVLDFY